VKTSALWASLIGFVGLVVGLLGFNLASDNTPVLGLDLKGGLSVIYATSEPADAEQLVIVRDLMRGQLESFGIAEPDVRVEGENIIVDLPGVNDQEAAFEALQVSGIVTLRPVISCQPGITTADSSVSANDQAILPYPGADQSCLVGPSGGTGEVFEQGSASSTINQQTGQWVVNVDLRSDGQVVWNQLAATCYGGGAECPSRQLAIVLDDVIQSAPTVQTPDFPGSVQISGAFSEDEVRSLARVLNRGAFPVPVEQQRVETVSATAGQDSLNAAVIAGLIGVAAVLAFMIAYYRRLSVVILVGLVVWGMTVFSLAVFVSRATNYALTLAGATGIIVAVGVTVDTYVVFFERLKDEVRHGRTIRNAAPRSFNATWRTIVSADLVSLMASLILFWLSVGSVKGFALYLGLTTIADLLVFYFYTRPAVFLLSHTSWFDKGGRTTNVPATVGAVS
jgi:preprotein translocase subunit SecD